MEDNTDYEVTLTVVGKICHIDEQNKSKNILLIGVSSFADDNGTAVQDLLEISDKFQALAQNTHPDMKYKLHHFYSATYNSLKVQFNKDEDWKVANSILMWLPSGDHFTCGWAALEKSDIVAVDLRVKGFIYKNELKATVTNEVVGTVFIMKDDQVNGQPSDAMLISPKKKKMQ
ncbi:hypothetical protein MP228_000103 [Amoeboaphelidium protococcarum]|nr:hypothetical protein MP228_000103 [Amoeboaphelidium protococcarum]